MAGYLSIRRSVDEFTAADIIALAAQLKRRKVSPSTKVEFCDHHGTEAILEMRVPIKLKVTPVPVALPTTKKSPMRGARKGRH